MLQITQTNCASTGELLDNSLDTIEFYGFNSLEHTLKQGRPFRTLKIKAIPSVASPSERKLLPLTKTLVSHGFHRGQVPYFAYQIDNGSTKVSSLSLHAIGIQSAIAEGVLLASLAAIVKENGLINPVIHINSIGDKESSIRFLRELTAFLRSHLNTLPGYARDEMSAGNTIRAYMRLIEKKHEIVSTAPNSMEFLNDDSRSHLHDVLEHIERIGIPYELDPTILGSNDCWQHTIFELRIPDENGNHVIFAHGGRHDTMAQKIFRVEMPMVSITIEHEVRGRTKPRRRTRTEPKFFFAQLGPQAKMKTFTVLDQLRHSGVPTAQQVALQSIGEQLANAEAQAVPYTIIIGHKEALEDTAIVRNMDTRSQVVIPLTNLPSYLKRLKV